MSQYSIRVAGGRVMVRGELVRVDILIDEGRIVALVEPANPTSAVTTIDATDRWVLPGIIDTHAHVREPGYSYKEDFSSCSRAAAVGGITTMIDMPNVEPPTTTAERFEEKRELASRQSIVDWGHWVGGTDLGEISRMARAGATGYKIFQVSGVYPHDPRLAINDEGELFSRFSEIADVGLPCLVHPFNQPLFDRLSQEALQGGAPSNYDTFSRVYTSESIWHTAVNTLLNLQALTGVRLQVVHTHSKGAIELIRIAKDKGQRVTASVDPKYYHLTRQDLVEHTARICPAGYVTEDDARMSAIWGALHDGTIDMIDADHAPHTLEEISKQNNDAWTAAMGSPQYDWHYSITLTDVHHGKLSLRQAVELLSEAPARLLGIWPRKGALLPGCDADLVLVDPAAKRILTDDGLQTKVGWTPYLGWEVTGTVELTMLRGVVIARDRQVLGEAGFGEFIAGVSQ